MNAQLFEAQLWATNPLLDKDQDRPVLEQLAVIIELTNFDATQAAGKDSSAFSMRSVAMALNEYRRLCLTPKAEAIATELPVRKKAPAGDGGGRYYWRVEYIGKCGGRLVESVVQEKNIGTLPLARKYAVGIILRGGRPTEIIPPDYDPQQVADDWTKNTSGYQEDGLTVRQRTKKH